MTLLLLEIAPRDDPDEDVELVPVLKRIFVVCCRNSTTIVSSGVVGRAKGQIKL